MSLWNWNYRMTGWSSWISCVNLSRRQKEEDEDDKKQVLHQNRTEWNQVFVNHFVWPAWHHAAVKRKFELVSVLIWSWRNMIVFVQFLAVTKLAFNDTLGSWNTFFHLLSVVISMRSGKTTLRGWRRKSLKPRIGSIGYFVCLFYLSHLFDIRFFDIWQNLLNLSSIPWTCFLCEAFLFKAMGTVTGFDMFRLKSEWFLIVYLKTMFC